MEKVAKLKDGTEITIRQMREDDIEKSFAFFQSLPDEDRAYLRVDVTKHWVVEERIRAMEAGGVKRLIALHNDEIVADGALELPGYGWERHVGEFRLIVARPYQRKGLGMLMASELYMLAVQEKVEEIVVRMMRPQVAARGIFRKLGFHEEILLPDYVKDIKGRKQDLILMRCNLEGMWQELEHYISSFDWWRSR